ncbi:MAG: AMP-binding protein [Oscillospiraceae bacterium]|nr:AMP-binding protein [Oscillospiraceae bacterium]
MIEKYLEKTEFSSYEDFMENYKVSVPDSFNFGFDVVDAWAAEDSSMPALVWCDDSGSERSFTFGDISSLSNRAANMFSSLGVKKGDVVMLILRRRWEFWVCAVALHKLGAIEVPATLQLTKKDIVYRAESAHISTIVCVNDDFVLSQVEAARKETDAIKNAVVVGGTRQGFLYFDDLIADQSDSFPRPTGENATKSTDTMLVYFTSGTTGMPKMVMHDYRYPVGQIVTAKYWQMVQKGKLHMSVSDSGWAKFGWGKIYGQWMCGAVIFAYDMLKFKPLELLKRIEKYRLTTFCAPPTIYRFMLQEDVASFDLSSVQRWCTAGEPINPEVMRRWEELTGRCIAEGFGQSESTVMIANFPWFEPRYGSTGKPAPLYNIQLIGPDGDYCEDGDEGEIAVTGLKNGSPPGLFRGYMYDEERTREAVGGDCYNLRDVAWRDSEGYYWFVGRHDDVIKCSGYRIGPFEVESALLEHPSVVECAVTGAPDPVRGQVVKATVVLAAGWKPSDELIKELQNHVKKVTAPYKYPRIVQFVDELPKTVGGKIKRAEIRNSDLEKA